MNIDIRDLVTSSGDEIILMVTHTGRDYSALTLHNDDQLLQVRDFINDYMIKKERKRGHDHDS